MMGGPGRGMADAVAPTEGDTMQLIALLEDIVEKESQMGYLRAHAKRKGESFAELLLKLCASEGAKAHDDDLLACIDKWPGELTAEPARKAAKERGDQDLDLTPLIKDLAAFESLKAEGTIEQPQHMMQMVIKAYARSKTQTLAFLLKQMLHEQAITFDEARLSRVVSLGSQRNYNEWEAKAEPSFLTLRDRRGRHAKMCFLGAVQGYEELASAGAVCFERWGLSRPSTAITLDAGTMHPRRCDEKGERGGGLCTLPMFQQFLAEAGADDAGRQSAYSPAAAPFTAPPSPPPSPPQVHPAKEEDPVDQYSDRANAVVPFGEEDPAPAGRARSPAPDDDWEEADSGAPEQLRRPHELWRSSTRKILESTDYRRRSSALAFRDAGSLAAEDFEINDLIHDKMLNVFTALLDAAKLSNSWIVVDRTQGEGGYSATAEYLLELSLERGSRRPTIIVIDSLQRLSEASNVASNVDAECKKLKKNVAKEVLDLLPRYGQRSFKMHKQLRAVYDATRKQSSETTPRATAEIEQPFDFLYSISDFETADGPIEISEKGYTKVPDDLLPFKVVAEHKNDEGKCDPNRKWAYFYDDSMFSSGTHYVIKNKDIDEFNLESITGSRSFLYAHGDRRTCERLREHIQQGQQTVMLYNSGGIVQPFSWLQRVMAFSHRPPSILRMRDPLNLLLEACPACKGLVGVPEMLIFQTLASRAPHLFRKNIVSVDLLLDDDEKMLHIITGCFSGSGGGVPELGLGNAEVCVIYSSWSLVQSLDKNANWFLLASTLLQWTLRTLAVASTVAAIVSNGALDQYFYEWEWFESEGPSESDDSSQTCMEACPKSPVAEFTASVIVILPLVTAFFTAIMGSMKWRDKWAVCRTASAQITSEIYNFRMAAGPYDPANLLAKSTDRTGGGTDAASATESEAVAQSAAELQRLSRDLFSERVQEIYSACNECIAQGGSLYRKRRHIRHASRAEREQRFTFREWLAMKAWLEHSQYGMQWKMPLQKAGLDFSTWITGLRPYVENTLQDELLATLDKMDGEGLKAMEKEAKKERKSGKEASAIRKIRLMLERQLELKRNALSGDRDVFRVLVLDAIATAKEEHLVREKNDMAIVSDSVKDAIMNNLKISKVKNFAARRRRSSKDKALDRKTERQRKLDEAGRQLLDMVGDSTRVGNTNGKQGFDIVEDDYLVGPLSVDSYVVFRSRPMLEYLERKSRWLAIEVQAIEVLVILIQTLGTVLAAFGLGIWVALTVSVAGLMSAGIAFTSMHQKLAAANSGMQLLSNKITWWDAQTLVVRRAARTRRTMVDATETAYLRMIEGGATATSQRLDDQDDDEHNADMLMKAEAEAGGGKHTDKAAGKGGAGGSGGQSASGGKARK